MPNLTAPVDNERQGANQTRSAVAKPHPENTPGDFYVEDGCCIACGVPEDAAPETFGWASDGHHCVVKRQPVSARDIDRMLVAICSAEADCIRYRGTDDEIARRIAESGHADLLDRPAQRVRPKLRSQVRFSARAGDTPALLADRLRAWLTSEPDPFLYLRVKRARPWSRHVVVYAWDFGFGPRAHYNQIRFGPGVRAGEFRATLRSGYPGAGVGLALSIHDWLTDDDGASDVRWFAADEDVRRDPGFHMPV